MSLIFGAVVLIGATAPLWHMWADKASKEEFVGFINFRRFLFAFGSHFASFCLAGFLFWVKNFVDSEYKKVIKIINIVGGVFIIISSYFLLWAFNPYSDFPKYFYEIIFIVAAIFIAYGIYNLNRFVINLVLDKKRNIKNLISFIVRVRTKHYRKVAAKALHAEEYKKPMHTEDTVEDNANEFEEDFYETLERVDSYK